MHKRDDHLVVADNLARYYLLNINTGEVIWEKGITLRSIQKLKHIKKGFYRRL